MISNTVNSYDIFTSDEYEEIITDSNMMGNCDWTFDASTTDSIFTYDTAKGLGTMSTSTIYLNDETFRLFEENQKEEKMREEYPALQEAWEQYQLIKKFVEEQECDKYTETRHKTFGGK